MVPPKRIALLLFGLGVAEVRAEDPIADEQRLSPIFAPPAGVEAATPVKVPPVQTPVQRQLASLLRVEIAALAGQAPRQVNASGPEIQVEDSVRLEKMTVQAKRIMVPPLRESALDKFTRTGHLWEFSKTKRFMVGPRGDKVGLMFSFDW